jgi:hypothetical protein
MTQGMSMLLEKLGRNRETVCLADLDDHELQGLEELKKLNLADTRHGIWSREEYVCLTTAGSRLYGSWTTSSPES